MTETPLPPHQGLPDTASADPAPEAALPEDEKLLDHVRDLLLRGRVLEGMDELVLTLKARRLRSTRAEWRHFVQAALRHQLRVLVHEDPFTRHAFLKPRGYPGDAVLLDYIYAHDEGRPLPPDTTDLGRAIHDYTIRSPASEGVRTRREFIANLLDEAAGTARKLHVLAVASGHLREAELSSAIRRHRFGRFVAMDADPESLREVKRCYERFGVERLVSTVRNLLLPTDPIGEFDLVYSTGLFDYLGQPTAQRLAMALFGMLRPGGRLVLANFLPGVKDVGYMESYMAWELIYRTRAEMLDVVARVPQAEVHDIRLSAEENQNILFLQVTRAG